MRINARSLGFSAASASFFSSSPVRRASGSKRFFLKAVFIHLTSSGVLMKFFIASSYPLEVFFHDNFVIVFSVVGVGCSIDTAYHGLHAILIETFQRLPSNSGDHNQMVDVFDGSLLADILGQQVVNQLPYANLVF